MKQLISEQSSLYLQVMLTDAKISEKLLENANEGDYESLVITLAI